LLRDGRPRPFHRGEQSRRATVAHVDEEALHDARNST
jgi:hypothetical protein